MMTKRLFSLLVVGGIPTLSMVWLRTQQTTAFASLELVAYPLLFGGLGIVVVYTLKRHLLGESVAELNRGKGRLLTDVLWELGTFHGSAVVVGLRRGGPEDLGPPLTPYFHCCAALGWALQWGPVIKNVGNICLSPIL